MTLQEAILEISPQDVYDRLCTVPADTPVWPEDPCLCPLHYFFVEEYPDERIEGVDLSSVAFSGEDWDYRDFELPGWMTEYQLAMCDRPHAYQHRTMGESVEDLARMFDIE